MFFADFFYKYQSDLEERLKGLDKILKISMRLNLHPQNACNKEIDAFEKMQRRKKKPRRKPAKEPSLVVNPAILNQIINDYEQAPWWVRYFNFEQRGEYQKAIERSISQKLTELRASSLSTVGKINYLDCLLEQEERLAYLNSSGWGNLRQAALNQLRLQYIISVSTYLTTEIDLSNEQLNNLMPKLKRRLNAGLGLTPIVSNRRPKAFLAQAKPLALSHSVILLDQSKNRAYKKLQQHLKVRLSSFSYFLSKTITPVLLNERAAKSSKQMSESPRRDMPVVTPVPEGASKEVAPTPASASSQATLSAHFIYNAVNQLTISFATASSIAELYVLAMAMVVFERVEAYRRALSRSGIARVFAGANRPEHNLTNELLF